MRELTLQMGFNRPLPFSSNFRFEFILFFSESKKCAVEKKMIVQKKYFVGRYWRTHIITILLFYYSIYRWEKNSLA